MKNTIFTGACTALVTPFKNGRIDYYSLDKLIEYQIQGGISALLVAGTTGESSVLSYREHRELIRHSAKRINGRVPLIAGAGSNDTQKAVKMTEYSCEYGADGILSVTPYYNKANQKGLIKHYEQIAYVSEKPIILYNVPGRTSVNINPETYKAICRFEKICGIKEASTNLSDAAYTTVLCPDTPIYCGNDDLLIPMLSIGAKGVISVMSNIFPQVSSAICRHWDSGNHETAVMLYKKYLKISKLLFADINPIPIKYILKLAELCSDELRLPLVSADDALCEKLTDEYKKLIV